MNNPGRNSARRWRAWSLGLTLCGCALAAPGALAADCLAQLPGVGIGGTGTVAAGTGLGGTGAVAQGTGIGGTGAVAQGQGVGGTGDVAQGTGIGGTGAVAQGTGIGGTGAVAQGQGVGGTGDVAQGMGIGGTGAVAQGTGVGGTGAVAESAGIGGTGAVAQSGGIGGTGSVADGKGIGGTGIVGVVTGFGSVCVNGVEVQFDASTPIAPSSVGPLAIGQVVAIEAGGDGASLRARQITVLVAVSGPVSSADAGQLQVLGQSVRVLSSTVGAESAAALRPGEAVRVSGLRLANGEIVASRIDRAPREIEASLRGRVTEVAGERLSVQGVEIVPAGGVPRDIAPGREVAVSGKWDGARLVAGKLDLVPAAPFDGRVGRLTLQGFVAEAGAGRTLRVGDTDIVLGDRAVFSGGTAADVKQDRAVIVSGRLTGDGKLNAEEVRVLTGIMPRGGPRAELGPVGKGDSGRGDKGGVEDRPERVERPERPEKVERPERPERVERPERPERPEGTGGRGK
ncbi:MAG TPA: DUF5666 domain-containing protein [Burkholderiales bacterium]